MKTIAMKRIVENTKRKSSYRVHLERMPKGTSLKVKVHLYDRIEEYVLCPEDIKGKNSLHFKIREGKVLWQSSVRSSIARVN